MSLRYSRTIGTVSLLASLAFAGGAHAGDKVALVPEGPSSVEGQVGIADWDRLVEAARNSADLRLRIVASIDGVEDSGGVYFSHEVIPLETLVEQARGSTDPMVLSMLVGRCSEPAKPPRCDAQDLAERWTVADTQNQKAWLTLAAVLQQKGDVPAARAAFERASRASTWHEHNDDIARVIAASIPRSWPPLARMHGLEAALGIAAARTISPSPFSYLTQQCRDSLMRAQCGQILETMFRDGNDLFSLSISSKVAAIAHIPDDTVKLRQQKFNATYWALIHEAESAVSEPTEAADVARAVARLEERIAFGEMRYGQRALERSAVAEADAASRFASRLAAQRSAATQPR